MPGMQVIIGSTCEWRVSGGDGRLGREAAQQIDGHRGELYVGQDQGEEEFFEATLRQQNRSDHSVIYHGPSLDHAIAELNERLAGWESIGAVPVDTDSPTRLGPEDLEEGLAEARELIADWLAQQPEQPPQPIAVVRVPTAELKDKTVLFEIGRGTLYVARHAGRPVIAMDEASMASYTFFIPEQDRAEHRGQINPPDVELDEGEAIAAIFANPEARWEHIAAERWDRKRDGYLREEMRAEHVLLGRPPGSFEDAYAEMRDAIESLPCESCGEIHWPVAAKPERGSADWWEDPSPYWACRHCGKFVGLMNRKPWGENGPTIR